LISSFRKRDLRTRGGWKGVRETSGRTGRESMGQLLDSGSGPGGKRGRVDQGEEVSLLTRERGRKKSGRKGLKTFWGQGNPRKKKMGKTTDGDQKKQSKLKGARQVNFEGQGGRKTLQKLATLRGRERIA